MNLYATVFGSSATKYDSDEYITAYKLGGLLVKKGFKVKCGGYYGTMEACSKGALEAGQKALGFPFKGFDPKKPNKYAEITKVETILVISAYLFGFLGSKPLKGKPNAF